MPATYRIDPAQRIVYCRAWGIVTTEDVLDNQRAFADDPLLRTIHQTATEQHYRTHEFGDSLLIERRNAA